MFDQVAKRSNRYGFTRQAALPKSGVLLFVIAERVNVRQRKPITGRQIARAALT